MSRESIVNGLTPLERDVLDLLLAGDHPTLEILRRQAACARLVSRELTGVGFFCNFELIASAPSLPGECDFDFGDVEARIEGLQHGAGFVLFVKDGRIDFLEGYSFDEPWPEEVREFSLSYHALPRVLNLPIPDPPS